GEDRHYRVRQGGILLDFFFQAEDGIRGRTVTGVQTCALPICFPADAGGKAEDGRWKCLGRWEMEDGRLEMEAKNDAAPSRVLPRSEERRVGKECGSRRQTQPATKPARQTD